MVSIRAVDVTKRFGQVVALDQVNLEIRQGEFFTLLGPSGCGKTTFLRTIAGFELVDEGRIYFDEEDVTYVPPHKRDTGMVFQNYALWPHMTVYDNIAYGLRVRKLPKEEIDRRVKWALKLVHMEGFERRRPHQLSGGQQQRVALARALVIHPRVLLLDEPLSNLDAKLRIEMRSEIRRLQRELGITTIYVTHDQEEALAISDRIAVMSGGRVMQVGPPEEIYLRPANRFVADFIGRGTFLEGRVLETDHELVIELESGLGTVKGVPSRSDRKISVGERVLVAIRPESFTVTGSEGYNTFDVVVRNISFVGSVKRVEAEAGEKLFIIDLPVEYDVSIGGSLRVYVKPSRTIVIPLE